MYLYLDTLYKWTANVRIKVNIGSLFDLIVKSNKSYVVKSMFSSIG